MSTKAVVDRTVADRDEDDKDEHLCLFENSISVDIFYTFLDYGLLNGNDDTMAGSIILLARLEAWVATVQACLEQSKTFDEHRQKLYGDTFTSPVIEAID